MKEEKKYKILVLSDLNKSTGKTIKSSISIAKIVNADINFFYVKKPTEVVEKESQLSAMRTFNKEYFSIDKTIKGLITPIAKEYQININYSFTIGNLKNEIENHINENKPDIIVLGKRKTKIVNFMRDNITQFILKKHKGTIVITDDTNPLEPNKELSLGSLNQTKSKNVIIENILSSSKKPLTSFKILDSSSNLKDESFSKDKNTTEYVFEKGDNVVKNISTYLSKSSINLLLVNRNHSNMTKSNIKEVINNLNCSLILTT
ncbi:universal stress protein [Polaribacter sp. Q13]|uniref:universal stress protein n=1 Tax=Polaribacter sp. Q13 TaxID=2806551 RepID=UPI00193C85B5|nr:universal stress protein [Polaribacter sp. Q13]QVY64437.1 universal stress protein [Polaribacter sp. Q13]